MVAKSEYIKASRAADISTTSGRIIYRLFEILPGTLAWITIIGIFMASRFAPIFASFFIIAFDIYWLLKTVFLSLHLRAGYRQMQKHLATDWMTKLEELRIQHSPASPEAGRGRAAFGIYHSDSNTPGTSRFDCSGTGAYECPCRCSRGKSSAEVSM